MCTRKIKRKKGVQFKELIEVSLFLLLHFFFGYFVSVLLPCLIMSSVHQRNQNTSFSDPNFDFAENSKTS